MTDIRINHDERKIILSSAFVKRASIPGTWAYDYLQSARNDNPGYALVTRKFKANTSQERYRGLNYEYMRNYIRSHEDDAAPVLAELEEMIGISKGHSLCHRYPTIKSWFLNRYPAFAEFGMPTEQEGDEKSAAAASGISETNPASANKAPAATMTDLPAAEFDIPA